MSNSLLYWGVQHQTQLKLKEWPHQCKIMQKDQQPRPAGSNLLNAAQGSICFLYCKVTLLAHAQIGVPLNEASGSFWKADFHLISPCNILVHGVVLPQAHYFAVALSEQHEVPVSPFLQLTSGSMTFWAISHFFQLGVTCKLAKGTLCPAIKIINEDAEQDWTQKWPSGYTAGNWPWARLQVTHHHSLGQPLSWVSNNLTVCISTAFLCWKPQWSSDIDNTHCSSLI